MKMGICSHRETIVMKLKDLVETKNVDKELIKHYTFILNHFDEVIAGHDKDIMVIEAKKAEILKQFIEAPQKLVELTKHLDQMTTKIKEIKNGRGAVKRFKSLRERLASLKAELDAEGIDVEELLKQTI